MAAPDVRGDTAEDFSVLKRSINGVLSLFRSYTPHVLPVVICALFIPLIFVLSVLSGFFVWKYAAVGWESSVHLQYGDGVQPYAHVSLPNISPQQPYDVSVLLVIPTTESNYVLGNFMSTLTLSTPSNKTLATVRLPAIAPPAKTFIFRSRPRLVQIKIPMLKSFVAGTSRVIAHIEIGRKDGWTSLGNGEGRELSVFSTSIQGAVVRTGIRGYVARFPLTAAFASSVLFFAVLSLILGLCIFPVLSRHVLPSDIINLPGHAENDSPKTLRKLSISGSDDEHKHTIRMGPRNGRSKTTRRRNKSDTSVTLMSPELATEQLRRRPSRRFDRISDSD